MSSHKPAPALLTVSQAARVLCLSVSSVEGFINRNFLPSLTIGRSRRIQPEAITAFIEDQRLRSDGNIDFALPCWRRWLPEFIHRLHRSPVVKAQLSESFRHKFSDVLTQLTHTWSGNPYMSVGEVDVTGALATLAELGREIMQVRETNRGTKLSRQVVAVINAAVAAFELIEHKETAHNAA